MGKHERGVMMTHPVPRSERSAVARSMKTRAGVGAVLVAALVAAALANVCAARTGDAGIADSDTVGSIAPAPIERSGSLAVYPLLY